MLVDLNNLDVLEVFILSIRLKCHLRIFLQNMRVVLPSREVMCSCQSKKVLIISSWSLYLISVGPFKFFKRVALLCTTGTGKTLQLFLAFSKYTLENILFNLIKNDCFFVKKLLLLFIRIFVTYFLKCISKYIETLFSVYACRFKQLRCFRSFHFPYIPQTPSAYIWAKHQSLSTLQNLVNLSLVLS